MENNGEQQMEWKQKEGDSRSVLKKEGFWMMRGKPDSLSPINSTELVGSVCSIKSPTWSRMGLRVKPPSLLCLWLLSFSKLSAGLDGLNGWAMKAVWEKDAVQGLRVWPRNPHNFPGNQWSPGINHTDTHMIPAQEGNKSLLLFTTLEPRHGDSCLCSRITMGKKS